MWIPHLAQTEVDTEIPDSVIIAMLKREVLLTRAKLHGLMYDHIMSERRLRSLKTQLRQVGHVRRSSSRTCRSCARSPHCGSDGYILLRLLCLHCIQLHVANARCRNAVISSHRAQILKVRPHALLLSPDPLLCAQGEPEFERLKRELEDVKNAPRGLEGTFRTAAEMERHRAQLADAAIEEQLEVQTTFREHGARLQV